MFNPIAQFKKELSEVDALLDVLPAREWNQRAVLLRERREILAELEQLEGQRRDALRRVH